jgi:DNA-binding NarL/FixJ family response regulator
MALQKARSFSLSACGEAADRLKLHVSCWSEPGTNGSKLQLRAQASRPAFSPAGTATEKRATWSAGKPVINANSVFKEPHLTHREVQVLRLIAAGHHNRWIARAIHRSIKTVEKHRQNLNRKLDVHDTAGLTRYALWAGISPRKPYFSRPHPVHLTPRETDVLRLLAQGLPNKGIADALHRSINTVENHRERMMSKLGLHEIASLTRYAVSIGLVAAALRPA